MAIEEFKGVLVIGGGLVGSYAALSFARKGYQVRLLEYRPDFTQNQSNETLKRSINLAFSTRAREAIEDVELLDKVEKLLIPMHGRAIHLMSKKKEKMSFEPDQIQLYDEIDKNNFNNSISRTELNLVLLRELSNYKNVEVKYECRLKKVDKNLICTILENDKERQVQPTLLLGCDGAYSSVRHNILKYNFSRYEQFYIAHGYKEFTLLPGKDGNFALPKAKNLHIWPRGEFMMIALPNMDKSFTCTLFAPLESLNLKTKKEIISYFSTNFPSFLKLIPNIIEQYETNPTSRLVSVEVDDWKYITSDLKRCALLLGDAAHACVPFYGQGMNCGLEDVLELSLTIDEFDRKHGLIGEDLLISSVIKFNKNRIKDAQSCSKLSYNNYKEMSSHTMSKIFLLRCKFEGLLNYFFGKSYIPLYKMVSFTRIPYSEVIKRNKRQNKIISTIYYTTLLTLVATATSVVVCLKLKR